MRKLLLFLIFVAMPVFAQQYPTTPNLGLTLPPYGVPNWQIQVNGNFTILDSVVGALQVPYQGTWISTYAYTKGQIVTYAGALYMSTRNNNLGNNPSTSLADWTFVIEPGNSSLNSPHSTLIISPTSGNILADINLNNSNTWIGTQTFSKLNVTDTSPTFSGIAGASTFCLQVSSAGVLSNTGAACGSGGGGGVNPSSVPLPLAFYPAAAAQVSPTLQTSSSVIGPSYIPSLNQFSTPNAYGWQPQGTLGQSTISGNRDNQLNQECDLADYNGVGMGTNEQGDEGDKIYQCEILMQSWGPGVPRVINLHGRSIRLTHPNGMIITNRDFGDYNSASTGSGAIPSLVIDPETGKITSCSVNKTGTTGYNPNGWMPFSVYDTTFHGSGATGYITTDGSGNPSGCVMELQGMNYSLLPGAIITRVVPQGADGATATLQLTSGTFSTSGVVTAGGNGYAFAPSIGVPIGNNVPGTLVYCTSYPTVGGTVSGGQIATITSTTGSGCTYNGASTAVVPLCVGGCVNGVQATNIQPEAAQSIPVGIPLLPGVTIDCDGGTIQADYTTGLASTSEMIVLGDAIGLVNPQNPNANGIVIRNCNLGGFIDIFFAGPTRDVTIENNHFGAQPKGGFTFSQGPGAAMGIFMPQVMGNTVIDRNVFLGNMGIVCGGVWTSRTGGGGGLGSFGGIDISQKSSTAAGGKCSGLRGTNISMYQGSNNSPSGWVDVYNPPTISGQQNNYSQILDQFVESTLWKAQNTSLTNPYAPNGQGTCYSSLTIVPRAIDYKFGNLFQNSTTYPFFPCFRGASDMIFTGLSRYGFPSQVSFANINNITGLGRDEVIGSFDDSEFSNFYVAIAGRTYTDPYLPPSTKQEGIITSQTATTSHNTIIGIFAPVTSVPSLAGQYQLAVSVTSLNAADVTQTLASGLISLNSQPTYFQPNGQLQITTNYSANLANIPGSGTSSIIGNLGMNALGGTEIDISNQSIISSTGPILALFDNTLSGYNKASYFTANGAYFGQVKGSGSVTLTPGSAAGTSPGTPTVYGTSCDTNECTFTMVIGTSPPTTGTIVSAVITSTRHDMPSCMTEIQNSTTGKFPFYAVPSGGSTTTINFTATGTALNAGSTYYFTYHCGGW